MASSDSSSEPGSPAPRPVRVRQPSTLLRGFFRDVDFRRLDWQERRFESQALLTQARALCSQLEVNHR